MSEHPLRCPNCNLCNLRKVVWGEWKCPRCGYIGSPKIQQDLNAKVELSPSETIFEKNKLKAGNGDRNAIKKIIDLLDHCDSNLNSKIKVFLLQHKNQAEEEVINSLRLSPNHKKKELIRLLALYADDKSVEALCSQLEKSSIELKFHLINSLGEAANPRAITTLVEQLCEKRIEIKKTAIIALLRIDPHASIYPIISEMEKSLDDSIPWFIRYLSENPKIIAQCSENNYVVIQKLWEFTLKFLNTKNSRINSKEKALLSKIVPISSFYFKDIYENTPEAQKPEVLDAFCKNGDETAISTIFNILESSSKDVIERCILSLIKNKHLSEVIENQCRLSNENPLKFLIIFFLSSEKKEFVNEFSNLFHKNREYSVPILIELADLPDYQQNKKIEDLLFKTNLGSLSTDFLIQKLPLISDEKKKKIIPTLGTLGNSIAIKPLVDLLITTNSNEVRIACSHSLKKIKSRAAVDLLIKYQNHDDPNVQKIIKDIMDSLWIPKVTDKYLEDLEDRKIKKREDVNQKRNEILKLVNTERRRLKSDIKKLKSDRKRMESTNSSKKLSTHHPIERMIRQKSHIASLLSVSTNGDKVVRLKAISTLKNIESSDAINALKIFSLSYDQATSNLAKKVLYEKWR